MAGEVNVGTITGKVELDAASVAATLGEVNTKLDLFASKLDQSGKQVKKTGGDLEVFGSSVKEWVEDPLGSAGDALESVAKALGPIGVTFVAVSAAVAAVGAGLYELASNAAGAGEGVLAFSRITGDAVGDVGALAAAATIGGSSLDGLQGLLFQVERRMDATGDAAVRFDEGLKHLGISATEFRAADPSDRVALLSEGMHSAAGNATLMADAIAVMGRGAIANMPLLLKNFDDLKQRGEEVAYQWSEADTTAAEEFNEAGAQMSERLKTIAETVGVALIPAMTQAIVIVDRTILAFEHVADLGGLVSGTWHAITGAVGETAEATQSFLAAQDTANKLWADAAAAGEDLSTAAYSVATQMLAAGYSIETVAEQSGLSVDAVKELSATLKETDKAAKDTADAWDRVNTAMAGGNDISEVDSATQDLVKSMLDANVKMEDIVATTGLATGQINELKTSIKTAAKEANDYATSWTNLNTLGQTYLDTLGEIDPAIKDQVEYYAATGAAVGDLVKAFPGLTQAEAEAAKTGVSAAQELQKTWSDTETIIDEEHGNNITNWIKRENDKYAQTIAMLQASGKATAAQLDAELAKHNATVDAEIQKRAEQNNQTKAFYQKAYDDAKANFDLLNSLGTDATDAGLRAARDTLTQSERDLAHWGQTAADNFAKGGNGAKGAAADIATIGPAGDQAFTSVADGIDAMNSGLDESHIKVKELNGDIISLAEARDRLDAGGSSDVTSQNFEQQLQSIITTGGKNASGVGSNVDVGRAFALAKQGYSFNEILAIFNNAQNGASGPIPPPQGPRIPGFREGGVGDFGDGTLAMLHGHEAIVPLDSNTSLGGDTNHFYIQSHDPKGVAQEVGAVLMRDTSMRRKLATV
jgi:hypothetical protein